MTEELSQEIITRALLREKKQEAIDAGLTTYEGSPCHRCKKTERYITNRGCKACVMVRMYKSYHKRKLEQGE